MAVEIEEMALPWIGYPNPHHRHGSLEVPAGEANKPVVSAMDHWRFLRNSCGEKANQAGSAETRTAGMVNLHNRPGMDRWSIPPFPLLIG
jgi:hypothetical protein